MMIRSKNFMRLFAFCTKSSANPNPEKQGSIPKQSAQSSALLDAQKKVPKIPVHQLPYNKQKYEIPIKKIKKNSGYALVQIEPFPRARIMKICYNLLTEVKKDIPQNYIFRILLEEKIKYIMDLTDKQEDAQILESMFGGLPIQMFIRNLSNQFQLINVVRKMKPWIVTQQQKIEQEEHFAEIAGIHLQGKYPQYKKPERTKSNVL